jgi:hypothetical protein
VSTGSTRLLKPFALVPRDENFWAAGITAGLGVLVEEAERISKEMGVVI